MENGSPGFSPQAKSVLFAVVIVVLLLGGAWAGGLLFRTPPSTSSGGTALALQPTATFAAWVTATPTAVRATTDAPPVSPTPTTPSVPAGRPLGITPDVPSRTPSPTPTPTVIPTEVPLLPIGEDTLVFALLGTDEERTPGTWRTDAIILAFVQPDARRVSLLSVPRDLWVYIPGYGNERINVVDVMGGLRLLDRTFRYNLGVPVHHSVRMNLTGFARIIDTLGGVTVDVDQPLVDRIPDPLAPSGWFDLALEQGPQHMDGETVLAYCRSRMTTSDFDRSRRQQQVLLALWQQAFTVDTIGQAPELWAVLGESFDTDVSIGAGLQLAQALIGLDAGSIRRASLSVAVEDWTTPEGAQVLLPKPDVVRKTILDLLS